MKKKQQQHPGGGADPWPHGAPLGGAPPGLGSWKRRVSLLPFLRFSLRDYGFCMAVLLVFCLGSLFYQLSGGPPRFLLDLRQYLGKEGGGGRGARRGLVALGRQPRPEAPRCDPGGGPGGGAAGAGAGQVPGRGAANVPRLCRRLGAEGGRVCSWACASACFLPRPRGAAGGRSPVS